jgi:hypothetical protein
MDKKSLQLGMNPSTASGRLVKDILFSLVVETKKDICYHCKEKINREDFSIEHKNPWLDSENPHKLFFDLDNIAFSHLSCNIRASRPSNLPTGKHAKDYQKLWREKNPDKYKSIRKDKYQILGT